MSSVTPPTPIADDTLSTGSDWGTPLDWFDLNIATIPGMSEATRSGQLAKALAYWQTIQAANVSDGQTLLKAQYAITWLASELTRVTHPPTNNLHILYPV